MGEIASRSVSVIGCGAIGSALAYVFANLGWKVELVGRGNLRLRSTAVKVSGGVVLAIPSTHIAAQKQRLWLIATKASDLEMAIRSHAEEYAVGDVLLIVANGHWLGDAKVWCAKIAERVEVFVGVTTFAVRPEDDGAFLFLNPHQGRVTYAPLYARNRGPIAEFKHYEAFVYVEDLHEVMTKKWLANCVINILAAACNLDSNREVLQHEQFNSLFDEVYDLSIAVWGNWSKQNKEALYCDLIALITETGENLNSMVRDRRLGRRLELKYTGGIVERYSQLHLPTLRSLVATLKSLPNDML